MDKKEYQGDPLLDCLERICQLEKRQFSKRAATAGLPMFENRLTPTLFVRAAERFGFSAKIQKRDIAQLSNVLLPAVVILNNNQAALLVRITEDDQCELYYPQDKEITRIPVSELLAQYAGYVIYMRPEMDFEKRAEQFHQVQDESWFWGSILRFKRVYGNVLIAALLTNLFVLVAPLFIMNVYDRVVPNNATATLWFLAIGAVIFFAFDLIARMLRSYLIDMAGRKADVILASRMFQQMLGLRMADKPASSGAFANYFNEFEILRDFFTSATLVSLIDVPFILLFLLVVWLIGGPIVLVPLIAGVLVVVVALLLEAPTRQEVERTLSGATQKQAILVETISGLEAIKTMAAEGRVQKKWEESVASTSRSAMHSRFLNALAINFTIWMQQLVTVGVVVWGVYMISAGTLTIGGLIAVTILSGRAVMLGQVTNLLTRYERSRAALDGLNKIMDLPTERSAKKHFLHRPNLKGNIEFDNVTFTYPDQRIPALHNVNLQIKAGERVGIIGRIGSGKSTLLRLMVGLYASDSGTILIDGADNMDIDPADLRNNINYVANDSVLFYGTVQENILMGNPDADDELILAMSQVAGVDRFVKRHPDGYEMQVGERGEGLSGGQRQAVALARSLVKSPSILLLDEPTSSMDRSTEQEFMEAIQPQLKDKTLLLVTHRASLLALVSRVIVLDEGKVIADGPKDKVLTALKASSKDERSENE